MARKRSKKIAASSSPSTVLVIFLVFFILLSMGLGLFSYYGYQAAQKKEEAGKKLKADAETASLAADYYKLQALWAKGASGHDLQLVGAEVNEPADLAVLQGELNNKFANEKTKAAVAKMIEDDKKELANIQKLLGELEKKPVVPLAQGGWDGKAQRFNINYREAWFKLKKRYDDLVLQNKTLQDKFDKELARQNARDETQKTSWTAVKTQIKNDNSAALKATEKADAVVKEANKAKTKAVEEAAARIKQLQDEFDLVAKQHRLALKAKDEEIAKLKVQKGGADAEEKIVQTDMLRYDTPRGKIIRVDYTGLMPYVNLGRADKVKEQLSFSIYGRSAGGKPAGQAKGSLEIVRVIGPHLSQARVIQLRDQEDPLLEGDLIYNPAWNPARKTHVAIAGLIDFSGGEHTTDAEQVRNLQQFLRTLERQNVVVDAYVDVRDGSVKGPGMTLKTDYFIVGERAGGASSTLVKEGEDKGGVRQKINEAMDTLRKEAVKKGVTVIPLHKFAVMSGYRLPRVIRDDETTVNGKPQPLEDKEPKEEKKKLGEEEKPKMEKEDKEEKKGDKKEGEDKEKKGKKEEE
jgi:hypothetical protein